MIATMTVTSEEREVAPRECSLLTECVIEPGTGEDWRALARYHYRSAKTPCVKQIYRARHIPTGRTVAVRVYASPPLNSKALNTVLDGMYLPGSTAGKKYMAAKINQEVELAIRTVVHPAFRGCGLAVKLVRDTLPLRPVRFVIGSTTMGAVSPFLERAGMEAHVVPPNSATVRVLAALRAFGVPEQSISDPPRLIAWVNGLEGQAREKVEAELIRYERFWVKGRTNRDAPIDLEHAIPRVSKNALLTPVFYLYRNPHWTPTADQVGV